MCFKALIQKCVVSKCVPSRWETCSTWRMQIGHNDMQMQERSRSIKVSGFCERKAPDTSDRLLFPQIIPPSFVIFFWSYLEILILDAEALPQVSEHLWAVLFEFELPREVLPEEQRCCIRQRNDSSRAENVVCGVASVSRHSLRMRK